MSRLRRARLRSAVPDRWRSALPSVEVAYFLALAVVALGPTLAPGYVLSLDMVFAPHTDYLSFGLHTKGPLYYGRLPLLALLDAVTLVVPHWVVQKAVLVGVVAGSGLAAYRALDGASTWARLYAGTLYAVNPFASVRLLAGHWYFLLGYAALPLAVAAFGRYLAGDGRLSRAVAWATVVSVFDPHAAVLLGVAWVGVGAAVAVHDATDSRVFARRVLRFGGVFVGVNAFWLAPALAAVAGGGTTLAGFSAFDLAAFSVRATLARNVPLSVATLHGFWRGGYVYPFDVLGLGVVLGLFVIVLFLAVAGWTERHDDPVTAGVALAAVTGLVLAMGVSSPYSAPVFRFLYEHVFVVKGMRDTQKFVALLALAYAYLGGRGVDAVAVEIGASRSEPLAALRRRAVDVPRPRPADRQTLLGVALAALLLVVPLAYGVTAVGGYWGQLESADYPEGWYEANEVMADDPEAFRALVLPWHQYVRFSWTGRTVASSTDQFFEVPVLRGRNVEVGGVESHATDPAHRRVTELLSRESPPDQFGADVAPLGVKYVVLLKEADHRQYDYLRDQPNLTVAVENARLVVFENRAFDDAPPPEQWPRASEVIPWWALAAGVVVTVGTVLTLLDTPFLRRRSPC